MLLCIPPIFSPDVQAWFLKSNCIVSAACPYCSQLCCHLPTGRAQAEGESGGGEMQTSGRRFGEGVARGGPQVSWLCYFIAGSMSVC